MKKMLLVNLVFGCLFLGPAAHAVSAAEIRVHVTGLEEWMVSQATITVAQYQPQYLSWPEGPWHWSEIASLRCNVQAQTQTLQPTPSSRPGIIVYVKKSPQGCIDPSSKTASIRTDAAGMDLQPYYSYLVKVNAPNHEQGKVEWIYLYGNTIDVYVNLAPSTLNVYTSSWTNPETGLTDVWYYVYNDGDVDLQVTLQTQAMFPGITSKQWTASGGVYAFTVPGKGGYMYQTESWYDPGWSYGVTYGEDNCHRGQVQAWLESGRFLMAEGTSCIPNTTF